MTLNPVCEHVETAQGVPLTVRILLYDYQLHIKSRKGFLMIVCLIKIK